MFPKFLFKILFLFSLLTIPMTQAKAQLIPDVEQAIGLVEELESQGDGLYVVTQIYEDLGIGVGFQFGLTESFAARFESNYHGYGLDPDTLGSDDFRHAAFVDWRLADSSNFIYLGTAFSHGSLLGGPSLASGIVWRFHDTFGLNLGHEYRNWADFDGPGEGYGPPSGHTFRVGLVHFFRSK